MIALALPFPRCCSEKCLLLYSVVEFLLGKGADVNVEDEFSSAGRMANRLKISPARGAVHNIHTAIQTNK